MARISKTELRLERETKGAILYTNPVTGSSSPVTSIYLRKSGMPTTTYPQSIHVTIESGEDIGE